MTTTTKDLVRIRGTLCHYVSRSGEIYVRRDGELKRLKPYRTKTGLLAINLWVDGRNKPGKSIARIVAEAFLPNPDLKVWVRHKDGDRNNNAADNLEWSEHNEAHKGGKKSCPVKATNIETGETLYFESQSEAARALYITAPAVSSAIQGRYKTMCGYRFEKVMNEHET